MSAAFTYTKPVYCGQSVVRVQEDSRFMGYWKRYDDKINNKYDLFQEYILQVQTLNITAKVVLFCKRNATDFFRVIFEQLRETATERRSICYPTGI